MATKIRLRRIGRKKQAAYRIVVAGSMHARDGRNSETIGRYNPRTEPVFIQIDEVRALHWLRQGAEASDSVRSLFRKTGLLKKLAEGAEGEGVTTIGDSRARTTVGVERAKKPSKKAMAKAEAPEAEAVATAPAPEAAEAKAAEVAPEAEAPVEAAAPAPAPEAAAEAPEAEDAAEAPETEATDAAEDAGAEEADAEEEKES